MRLNFNVINGELFLKFRKNHKNINFWRKTWVKFRARCILMQDRWAKQEKVPFDVPSY
jgi:hypothetical protein